MLCQARQPTGAQEAESGESAAECRGAQRLNIEARSYPPVTEMSYVIFAAFAFCLVDDIPTPAHARHPLTHVSTPRLPGLLRHAARMPRSEMPSLLRVPLRCLRRTPPPDGYSFYAAYILSAVSHEDALHMICHSLV